MDMRPVNPRKVGGPRLGYSDGVLWLGPFAYDFQSKDDRVDALYDFPLIAGSVGLVGYLGYKAVKAVAGAITPVRG